MSSMNLRVYLQNSVISCLWSVSKSIVVSVVWPIGPLNPWLYRLSIPPSVCESVSVRRSRQSVGASFVRRFLRPIDGFLGHSVCRSLGRFFVPSVHMSVSSSLCRTADKSFRQSVHSSSGYSVVFHWLGPVVHPLSRPLNQKVVDRFEGPIK